MTDLSGHESFSPVGQAHHVRTPRDARGCAGQPLRGKWCRSAILGPSPGTWNTDKFPGAESEKTFLSKIHTLRTGCAEPLNKPRKNNLLEPYRLHPAGVAAASTPAGEGGYVVPANQQRSRTVWLDGHVARRVVGVVEKILWDNELAGFGLRTQPTGHKTWIVKYEQHGRQIKVTLGAVGDLTA